MGGWTGIGRDAFKWEGNLKQSGTPAEFDDLVTLGYNLGASGFVKKSGDTMTGNLAFEGDDVGLLFNTVQVNMYGNASGEMFTIDGGLSGDKDLYINNWRNIFFTTGNPISFDAGLVFNNPSANLNFTDVGARLKILEGSDAMMGLATLSGGSATVANANVTANSRILLTCQGGTVTNVGAQRIGTITPGTGFTIVSANVLDASTVFWFIVESL